MLLQGALGLAVMSADKETAARIEAAVKDKTDVPPADRASRDDMLAKLDAARPLLSVSRAGTPTVSVRLDQLSVDGLATDRRVRAEIGAARAAGDADALAGLAGGLDLMVELLPAQRDALARLAADAQGAVPNAADPAAAVLRQLAASSRAPAGPLGAVAAFARGQLGKPAVDPTGAGLVTAALAAGKFKGGPPWGTPVTVAVPGCVVKLTGAKFSAAGTAAYPDRLGVVVEATGGRYWVVLPGTGPKPVAVAHHPRPAAPPGRRAGVLQPGGPVAERPDLSDNRHFFPAVRGRSGSTRTPCRVDTSHATVPPCEVPPCRPACASGWRRRR